jgi:hypothetical protein
LRAAAAALEGVETAGELSGLLGTAAGGEPTLVDDPEARNGDARRPTETGPEEADGTAAVARGPGAGALAVAEPLADDSNIFRRSRMDDIEWIGRLLSSKRQVSTQDQDSG